MKTYLEFVDKKERDSKRHLKIIKKMLDQNGFQTEAFFDNLDDPYVFLYCPEKDLSFEGVRIYCIGDNIAYRIQKEKDTHPYGSAYSLDIEGMYNDYISDYGDEEKSGKSVIKSVKNEFTKFFESSRKAEKEIKSVEIEDQSKDNTKEFIYQRPQILDYGATGGKA